MLKTKAECPYCRKLVAVRANGALTRHGIKQNRLGLVQRTASCDGSGRVVEKYRKAAQSAKLDLILDQVQPRQREVTIDTEGYTEEQVGRVIATAKGRGLSASYDGRYVLIRDMR